MKQFSFCSNASNVSKRILSANNSRNKIFTQNKKYISNKLSPIKKEKIDFKNSNTKNLTSFYDSSCAEINNHKIKREKSSFSFKTNLKNYKNNRNILNSPQNSKKRPTSHIQIMNDKWRFSNEPMWKKLLRGKLLFLLRKNIILCEKKFNPNSFTESLSNIHVKKFKNKFKNMDNRTKVGIFTNKFPQILNQGNKFYSRYFDHFISPDELLYKNFTKEEIYQIKADPIYFNLGGNFNNVNFFRKRSLKETLNEEEKVGPNKLIDVTMKISLKQTKKRIQKYMDYYSSIMSKQGIIS